MAEINLQPKRQSARWPWLLLAIFLLALIFFTWRSCNIVKTAIVKATDSGSVTGTTVPAQVPVNSSAWDSIDFNAPVTSYEEITDSNINIRGNDRYAVYSLGENILFDEGKSTIRADAENNLKQLSASIQKRFQGGDVRIYGHTDSIGSSETNKKLAEERADAVGAWLSAHGNIDAKHISSHPVGESQPVASNKTSEGRQQNRRVEVVAKK